MTKVKRRDQRFMNYDIKIDKQERRKRLIEDFKKMFGENNIDAIKFAENLPDEMLDKLEDMGFSSNRKVKVGSLEETLIVRNEKNSDLAMSNKKCDEHFDIFDLKSNRRKNK